MLLRTFRVKARLILSKRRNSQVFSIHRLALLVPFCLTHVPHCHCLEKCPSNLPLGHVYREGACSGLQVGKVFLLRDPAFMGVLDGLSELWSSNIPISFSINDLQMCLCLTNLGSLFLSRAVTTSSTNRTAVPEGSQRQVWYVTESIA